MERKLLFGVAAAASLALLGACQREADEPAKTAGAQAPAAPVSAAMPKRTPGLWEQTITTQGMTQTTQICLDQAVEERFSVWGQQIGQGACTENKVTPRAGGGWNFAASCDMGQAGKTSTQGSVSGDLVKTYKVEAQSTTSGAATAEMNGSHSMTLQATWKGPCPAGMSPGEMTLPGGMKINLMQIPTG